MKRFSITLIALTTIVYGSIFGLSIYHDTQFFDEILIQLNRVNATFTQKQEIEQSKLILKTIMENEHPPDNWTSLIVHNQENDQTRLFYFYKVWTIKSGLSLEDIMGSYPIYKSEQKKMTLVNMRYGKKKPVLQFPFFKADSGDLITGFFFPINELPFVADYNKDNTINHEDVLLARTKHKAKNQF
ncbi:MAG: hypothetical protein ABIJ59_10765 [Pseudomonadota bacterium]